MVYKNVLEFLSKDFKKTIIGILLPVVFVSLIYALQYDAMEQGKRELKEHIPNILIYNSNVSLNEVLEVNARSENFIVAINSLPLTTDGESVKKYYTENLLKLGWKEGGYKSVIYDKDRSQYYDCFIFDKGEYRLVLEIFPPLYENRKAGSSYTYTYKKPWYGFNLAKKGVLF